MAATELRAGPIEDGLIEDTNPKAYVHNALFHLNLLRSTIHDGLPHKSDTFLKVSLLYDLDDAEENLRKALL